MNKIALNRFSLVAPVLDSICQTFSQINDLFRKKTRDKHYQLTGTANSQKISNAEKLSLHFEPNVSLMLA